MGKNDTKHITEGRFEEVERDRQLHGSKPGGATTFVRMVVLEVISDPTILDKAKLSYYEHGLGVSNIAYASVAPRNSIIARPVMKPNSGASERVMVLYPFFPPHLSLPCKPGEHVWAVYENPAAQVHEIGYWMCRIVGPSFVEDVNYTHADRAFDKSFLPGLSDLFEGSDEAVYEFRNGAVDSKDGQRYTIAETMSLPGDEVDPYKKLLSESDASKLIDYEAVPRYRKRPADTVLEGSNNTLIVLGTDRTGAISDYEDDPDKGKKPKAVKDDTTGGKAGVIDLVVGRGQTDDTLGKAVENKPLGRKELGKHKKALAEKEGDVDFKNDRSRILIAQKTKPDKNFKIDSVVKAHSLLAPPPISDGDGEGAIVVKTDKIRLIARHDVVILVTGATETGENGVKDADVDPMKCASIILKANGDIIFTPSDAGLIRLGGADAALSPLCTQVSRVPGMPGVPGTGLPPPPPIVSSMGGAIGSKESFGPLNGTFATRVLIK